MAASGALLFTRRIRFVAEVLLAVSLGAWSLALRTHSPTPALGPEAALSTLLGAPERSAFGCRVLVWIHGARPGRALLAGPPETCAWLPGQQILARLDLAPLGPPTNPGQPDLRRRWERRGVRRVAKVVEGRFAPVGDPPRTPRGWIERQRRRAGESLGGLSDGRPSAALLRALVTGDRSRLDDAVRGPFDRSGTAHLLAVSGLHVGWAFAIGRTLIALALYPWRGVGVQRLRSRLSFVSGLWAAATYAALAGLSVPTLRALAMALAGGVALLAGRPTVGWNALLAAALLVMAVDPGALFDPGFLLSFVAVAGILLWQPSGGAFRRLVGASLGASLAVAPVLARLDLPVPALALAANLLLVPWFGGVVVPLGLATGLAAIAAPALAASTAPLAHAAATAGLATARLAESPDLRPWCPDEIWASGSMALLALRAWYREAPVLGRSLGAAAAALLSFSFASDQPSPRHASRAPDLRALFLDVRQGDSTRLRIDGRVWVVDAGPRMGLSDAGRLVVLPALREEGIERIDVLVLTHADSDHIGGAPSLIDRVGIGEIWVAAPALEDLASRRFRRRAAARRIPVRLVAAGDDVRVGTWEVRVLWPPAGLRPSSRNEGGLVLRVEGPQGCLMLPSDVPVAAEDRIAGEQAPCTVLKLGHHGSGTSTGSRWLRALRPTVAVASASSSWALRFPARDLRRRLAAEGVALWETFRWGAVEVRVADGSVAVGAHARGSASSAMARPSPIGR